VPSFADIRAALASNIAGSLPTFRVYAMIPAAVDAPAIIVGGFRVVEVTRKLNRNKTGKWFIPVRVIMGDASEVASQGDLDILADLNGAGGIVAAIESDPTLAGIAEGVMVTELSKYGNVPVGGADFIGFDVTVEVRA
jgi:hypothetical protein